MTKFIFISYSFFLLLFTIFSYAFVDSNLIYMKSIYTGFAYDNRLITTVLYSTFIIVFFIFYILFFILIKKNKLTLSNLRLLIIVTVGVLFLSYPAMLSFDIFNYIATAKVLYFYQENPYIIMPIEFTGDPLLLFMHAANKVALYGVSWLSLTSIPHFFGFGNFILTLFSFKLFIIMFYLGAVIIIWKISKSLFSVVLFALNPLVIIETLMVAHNDIVMMFLVLFSFYLLFKVRHAEFSSASNNLPAGKAGILKPPKGISHFMAAQVQNDKKYNIKIIFLAIFIFIVSIFIKYATLFLVPVFIYLLWKTWIKEKIVWDKIYLMSFLSMFLAFILAPIREEIYPWYAIWFIVFVCLIPQKRVILYTFLALSFSLLLRYIPFMYLGTHFGSTPMIKSVFTFILPIVVSIYFLFKENKYSYFLKIFSNSNKKFN